MVWNKAIKQIEDGLNTGANVGVRYHVKRDRHFSYVNDVESIVDYEYKGKKCKAINLYNNQLNEGTHIIDEVRCDWFFGTTWDKEV